MCRNRSQIFNCLLHFSADSPVLWIRVDTEMTLLRQVIFQQPDYQWQYQLRYERDIVAQIEVRLKQCQRGVYDC